MANKHNNLSELFTATANAIRSKTGSTDTIVADDFPEAIEGMEVGGGDTENLAKGIIERTITEISDSTVVSVGDHAFRACNQLVTVNLPEAVSIGASAFSSCSALKSLILRNTNQICTLGNTNTLKSTLIANNKGYIYVPGALIDIYKAATNWSTYAAQFRALEDYTVDGTTTGALDPNKI